VDEKWSRGRQRKARIEDTRQDLAEENMDLKTAVGTIRCTGRWSHLVETLSSVNT